MALITPVIPPVRHADPMVANIVAYWNSATPEQRFDGAGWYPKAGRLAELIAEDTGIDVERVVLAIAALSPRNPWRWNVMDAWSFAKARSEGKTMPTATTFNRNKAAAWRALDPATETPWLTSAPKVRAFVRAIMGDAMSVVVDTWAVRVATGGKEHRVATDKAYAKVAHAYVIAANIIGENPRTVQAVTWLVAQQEGLASLRRSPVGAGFKAGTPAFIRENM